MVKIRLARAGAKKRPFYHVVATDSRNPRDSHYLERIGYYNPMATGGEQKLVVDSARLEYWKKNGAQVSERVEFLVKQGAAAPATAERAAPKKKKGEGKAKAEAAPAA
jgi:small subunit ribosomal protein S16